MVISDLIGKKRLRAQIKAEAFWYELTGADKKEKTFGGKATQ